MQKLGTAPRNLYVALRKESVDRNMPMVVSV